MKIEKTINIMFKDKNCKHAELPFNKHACAVNLLIGCKFRLGIFNVFFY